MNAQKTRRPRSRLLRVGLGRQARQFVSGVIDNNHSSSSSSDEEEEFEDYSASVGENMYISNMNDNYGDDDDSDSEIDGKSSSQSQLPSPASSSSSIPIANAPLITSILRKTSLTKQLLHPSSSSANINHAYNYEPTEPYIHRKIKRQNYTTDLSLPYKMNSYGVKLGHSPYMNNNIDHTKTMQTWINQTSSLLHSRSHLRHLSDMEQIGIARGYFMCLVLRHWRKHAHKLCILRSVIGKLWINTSFMKWIAHTINSRRSEMFGRCVTRFLYRGAWDKLNCNRLSAKIRQMLVVCGNNKKLLFFKTWFKHIQNLKNMYLRLKRMHERVIRRRFYDNLIEFTKRSKVLKKFINRTLLGIYNTTFLKWRNNNKYNLLCRLINKRLFKNSCALWWEYVERRRTLRRCLDALYRTTAIGMKFNAFSKLCLPLTHTPQPKKQKKRGKKYCTCIHDLCHGGHCTCSNELHFIKRMGMFKSVLRDSVVVSDGVEKVRGVFDSFCNDEKIVDVRSSASASGVVGGSGVKVRRSMEIVLVSSSASADDDGLHLDKTKSSGNSPVPVPVSTRRSYDYNGNGVSLKQQPVESGSGGAKFKYDLNGRKVRVTVSNNTNMSNNTSSINSSVYKSKEHFYFDFLNENENDNNKNEKYDFLYSNSSNGNDENEVTKIQSYRPKSFNVKGGKKLSKPSFR